MFDIIVSHRTFRFVLVCVICSLLVVGVGGVAGAETTEINTNSEIKTNETLQNASGNVRVIVRFSGANSTLKETRAQTPAERKKIVNQSKRPLETHAAETKGVELIGTYWIANAALVQINTSETSIKSIGAVRGVERIHPNAGIQIAETTSSTTGTAAKRQSEDNSSYTPGLEQINVPETWERYGTRGENTTVAVLDSGVDTTNHTDLKLAENGWEDFVTGSEEPYDDNNHGTHVSGTIVGDRLEEGTHYGVAPEAELIHGKVANEDGEISYTSLWEGLQWVVEHESEVDVLSLSLGSEGYSLSEEIQTVIDADIVVVAAAGNAGENTSASPGNVPGVIAVGATNEDETVPTFSSGETVDTSEAWGDKALDHWPEEYVVPSVVAPGVRIESAVGGGSWEQKSGTSMATPHVSGTILLMHSAARTRFSPTEAETVLKETARKPDDAPEDPDIRYGHGIVDAFAAVESVGPSVCRPITETGTQTLTTSVTGEDSCFIIESDDVTIDLNGHTIGGQGVGSAVEIQSGTVSISNVTVRNGTISGWSAGVRTSNGTEVEEISIRNATITNTDNAAYLTDGTNVTLEHVRVENSTGEPIVARNVSNLKVANTTIDQTDATGAQTADLEDKTSNSSIELRRVSNVTIVDVSVRLSQTGTGVYVERGENVSIRASTLVGRDQPGLWISNTQDVSLSTVELRGEQAFRATDRSVRLEGHNMTIDTVQGVGFASDDLTLDETETLPEPPTGTVNVTDAIEIQNTSGTVNVTLPYRLVESEDSGQITAKAYNGTTRVNVDTAINSESETMAATVVEDGVLAGFVTATDVTHQSGVSVAVFNAVDTNDDGSLTLAELRNAVHEWQEDGTVDETRVTLGNLRTLVGYWGTQSS